jgi:hypothetical protein
MKLFVCIFSDARLLPHFLSHYTRFGVSEFHIAAPPQLANEALCICANHSVALYTDFDVNDSVTGGTAAVSAMRDAAQGEDEWVVIVDLDEFIEFQGPIASLLPRVEAEQANVVRAVMLDRFALDGQPTRLRNDIPIDRQCPVRTRFIPIVMNGADFKACWSRAGSPPRWRITSSRGSASTRSSSRSPTTSGPRVRSSACGADTKWRALRAAPWAEQPKSILEHHECHGRFAWETFGGEIVLASKVST